MIKRVKLENWKTHKESEFVFGRGTNVLIGVMGAGKTAVMDGICFALFGSFPALNARRLSLEEVIMAKPNEFNEARVELEFDYNEKNYLVERTIYRRGVNEGKLFCEGRLIAGPKTTEVTKRVEEIIEINYDLFSRAVYSEQNQLDYFLRLNPSQRKEKFDELLEINKYENVRGNTVTVSNRLKKLAEDKKNWLKEQESKIREQDLIEEKKKLERKEKENKGIEEKIPERKKELEKKEKETKGLEEKEKEFRFFKELVVKSNGKLESLKKTVKETKEKLRGKKPREIEEEAKKEEEKLKEKQGKEKELEKELDENQKELNQLIQGIGLNKEKINELNKQRNELKRVKANCPVCRSKLDEKTKKELEEENQREQKEIEKETEKLMEKKRKEEETKEKNSAKLRELKKAIEEVKEKKQDLTRLIEEGKELERKEKEATDLEKEIQKIEKELNELDFDEKELRKKRDELIELKTGIESLKKQAESNKEVIKEISESIRRIEENKKQLEELKKNIIHLEEVVGKLNIFTNALKATQSELREALINTVNEAMEDIWEKIYPYKDFTNTRIEVVEGNYEIMVRERTGKWVKAEGILSGGERSAVAITLRIAISLVLTRNLSWLILDEPTHNLDAEAVKQLSELTKEHLPQLVEQIFLITHDKQMESAASASLYLLQRDKSVDGATKPTTEQIE